MFGTDSSLMRTQQPAFQKCSHSVYGRHTDVGGITAARRWLRRVRVAELSQPAISAPAVGQDLRPLFDRVTDKGHEAVARRIRYPAHPYSPEPLRGMCFDGNDHDRTPFSAPPRLVSGMESAHVSLVNLNLSAEPFAAGPHHGSAQLVQPGPCRLVTAETKNPLQPQRAGPIFLAHQEPDRGIPCPQRQPSALENRASRHRSLASTTLAMQIAPRRRPRLATPPAVRTLESLRPAALQQVEPASFLVGKPVQKLLIRSRIVFSRDRTGGVFHDVSYYILWLLASNGYPLQRILSEKLLN